MRPLLIFHPPARSERIPGAPQFQPPPKTGGYGRQVERLTPKFDALQRAFANAQLQNTPEGYVPERTVVLQTAGPVTEFINACNRVPGLEFISEMLGEEFDPDEDFWLEDRYGNRQDKKLTSYVYMMTSNQEGIDQLLRYWALYQQDRNVEFPRGLTPLKTLFSFLKDVRCWEAEDRLRDTGLLEDWRDRVQHDQGLLPVEIELWFVEGEGARTVRQDRLASVVHRMQGQVLTSCCVPQIGYHALLAKLPTDSVRTLLDRNDYDIELLRCDEVWYFRPASQCIAPISTGEEPLIVAEDAGEGKDETLGENAPVVALLDGFPLENHTWLKDHLTIDDPDDWAEDCPAVARHHGTAMASLMVHDDRNANESPLPGSVYIRPIMTPSTQGRPGDPPRERIPEEILPVDLIHRCVRRIFEGDGDEPPAAPTVKVINLSIGDPTRLFDKVLSPLAKLIDWLSWKYKVIFVISAGNHSTPIRMDVNTEEFAHLDEAQREKAFFEALARQIKDRRLLSPAESMNAITVGASHEDRYEGPINPNLINPIVTNGMPSPLNPLSWGKLRSVKPDILMSGGKAAYTNRSLRDNDPVDLWVKPPSQYPPGQLVAAPTNQPGQVNGAVYSCGTSNAAALASRRLALLDDTLKDLYHAEYGEYLDRTYEAVLLKAMLVHGAEINDAFQSLRPYIPENQKQTFKAHATRFTGYGRVNDVRIHGCSDNQATVLQCGLIENEETVTYELPLPNCLNAKQVSRRLVITLAWLSPMNPKHNQYRQARLGFSPETNYRNDENPLAIERRLYDYNMVKKGTVQHEVLTGERAKPYGDNDSLKIEIKCTAAAGARELSIPYGLVVTLDSPDISLPIYDEVKTGIAARFRARANIQN